MLARSTGFGLLLSGLALAAARGEEARLPVVRDAWFSGVGSERDGSNGGATTLKLKSFQEMSLVDVDPAPIRGRVVLGAELHVRSTGPPILRRVTVGSFGSDWTEGTATNYANQAGSSTFRHRTHPAVPWTPDGGDLGDVILGRGGTTWRMAEASAPDVDGWQVIPVDPVIVAARVAGVSHGFLLFDDTGTEWTRKGGDLAVAPMPNRFVSSRDQNRASAPYLTVRLGPVDRSPPPAPAALASEVADLPAGEAFASWASPADVGPAGTVGFFASVDGRDLPRSMIPMPGRPGDRATIHLRDLGLAPGSTVALAVRAIDGAGNVGGEGRADVRVSARSAKPLPGADPPGPMLANPDHRLGSATVAIVDELDKLDPTGLAMIPGPGPGVGHRTADHLRDPGTARIRLEAARNEFAGFQVLVFGPAPGFRATLTVPGLPGLRAEFGRLANVATDRGPMPDPVVPLAGPVDLPGPSAGKALRAASIDVDLYIPRDCPAGEHPGDLILEAGGGARLVLPITLRVWDFGLPDTLSFLPELNCYGLPDNERDYYRLAHRHRTALNRVPYSQRGDVAPGMAPRVAGGRFDWTDWDRRFGPLLDGSAFADLERPGVPLDVFYLPLHENWPTPIEGSYDGGYWADLAFRPSYRRAFVDASRRFAAHLDERGWHRTIFQGFLNNKRDFKAAGRGWAGGSSPWLLDEPASFQDFWALRYFASAFAEGVAGARGGARLAFRADISRPEWQRDSLDGLLDYNVVGGAFRDRARLVLDRKRREGQLALEYGTTNGVVESNVMAAAWCVDAWSLGLDGVIPWQSVGRAESWTRADELALLYPGRGPGEGPIPSIRLKAYRRGQQDVEYLALLAGLEGEPRWAIGGKVREALKLAGERTGAEGDAGSIRYDRPRSRDLWALRHRVGQALSDARITPDPKAEGWRPRARVGRPGTALAPSEGGMVGPRP